MSTAPLSYESQAASAGATHFLLRRLHSLTGILFGGYLCVHLLVNATLIEGARHDGQPTVFQQQVDKIHSLPFLPVVEWALIYLPLLYHTIYGIWIVATGQPNIGNYNYGKNYAYFAQRVSAVILIFFIGFHVLTMKGVFGGPLSFDPANATATTVRHFGVNPWVTWLLYPVGILAGCFHLANGFWTAGITWGLTVSKNAQKRWGGVCFMLFLATFGCGMAALVAAARTPQNSAAPSPGNVPGQHYSPKTT